MLILTVERRNHSVNGPVCLKLCENINPLNVHSVSFKIEVGKYGAFLMLHVNYNIDSKSLFICKSQLLTDAEFSIYP
jgi:hypothetical protein